MATANVLNIRRIHARLVADPTNLSTAFPYGGTALGLAKEMHFRPKVRSRPITAEELGRQTIDVLYAGESATFAAVLRDYDDDALAAIWQQTETGSTGRTSLLLKPKTGSPRAGSLGSARSIKLLVAPTDEERDPFLILYRAIPLVEDSADLSFAIKDELGIGVVFFGIPDSSDRVYAVARKEDLSL